MILSINNVEKIIFYDKKVQQTLPELSHIFDKWTLGVRTGINSIAKDAMLDFLNKITPDQQDRLGSYFDSPVTVQKINSCLVKLLETDVYHLEDNLNVEEDFLRNVTIAREGDSIYLCLWR